MIVGIHPDRTSAESYSDKWVEFLQARGVEVRLLDLLAPDALEQAAECDGVMWRWLHRPQDKQSAQRILYVIEHYLRKPVFPNTQTAWHFDEKVAQHYLLHALGAPTPRTCVFWDQETALDWARRAVYPVVFKLSVGASSSNVFKVNDQQEAIRLIHRAFKDGIFPLGRNVAPSSHFSLLPREPRQFLNRVKQAAIYTWRKRYPPLEDPWWWRPEKGYIYFQEFLGGNSFDIRITVIGNRAFGFRRLNRLGDFRASGSGQIDYDPQHVDHRCVDLAFKLTENGQFQSMAYDFLYRNDTPVVSEISYTYVDKAVYNCPGYWRRDMTWQEGHKWPQEAQIEDFLRDIEKANN